MSSDQCQNNTCSITSQSCTRAGRTVVGGLSDDTKPANNEVRELVNSFKGEIEQETNKKYKTIEPLTYKTQVVAGLNYFIKVSLLDRQLHILYL